MLEKIKPSDEILKLYKNILIKEANAELNTLNSRIADCRAGLNDISETRTKAIKKFVEGEINKDEKDELTKGLEDQKLKTTDNLRKLEQLQGIREADIEQSIEFMLNVHEQWALSDFDLQQRFQSMLFPRGLIYDSKSGLFGTSTISELYGCITIEKAPEGALKYHLVAGAGLEPATLWL